VGDSMLDSEGNDIRHSESSLSTPRMATSCGTVALDRHRLSVTVSEGKLDLCDIRLAGKSGGKELRTKCRLAAGRTTAFALRDFS
jgi:hypothetical protein